MTHKWDVRDDNHRLVTDLAGLAGVLRLPPDAAAKNLLEDSVFLDAAPAGLQIEAKARAENMETKAKGGGSKPPPIANGSFVSWGGKKGRVDLIVTNGKVPGVDADVEGTANVPAARVVVYENDKATSQKVGVSTHTLKRIPPLGSKRPPGQKGLVAILADHETKCAEMDAPAHAYVTGAAVKAVYDRGLAAYPGEDVVGVDQDTWAVGRVEHFVDVAAGERKDKPGHDTDLLSPEHPLFTGVAPPAGLRRVDPPAASFMGGADDVTLDKATVDAELEALLGDL